MTMRVIALASLLAALACNNPADDAPAAAVSDPATPEPPSAEPSKPEAPEPAAPEPAGTLSFNGEGSSIQMVGSKVTGSHDVKINTFTGEIRLAQGGLPPAKWTVGTKLLRCVERT